MTSSRNGLRPCPLQDREQATSSTNLELITKAIHALERMLFRHDAAASDIKAALRALNILRWRLETEPAEAAESFWPLRMFHDDEGGPRQDS